jgi:hypothetical protein
MESKYGIFIIESLSLDNEKKIMNDGLIVKQILELTEIESEYFYIRTIRELKKFLIKYEESELRYLHFSLHGTSKIISTTFDDVDFVEFSDILGNYIENRRIFLSVCNAATLELAKLLIIKNKCYSVIGSPDSPYFYKAALFWSAFYPLIKDSDEEDIMRQKGIKDILLKLTSVFKMPINYYSFTTKNRKRDNSCIKEYKFDAQGNMKELKHSV